MMNKWYLVFDIESTFMDGSNAQPIAVFPTEKEAREYQESMYFGTIVVPVKRIKRKVGENEV